MKKPLVFILCLFFSAATAEARDIYVFAGQSNASGRGDVSELPDFVHEARVRAFGNNLAWRASLLEPSDSATGQVYPVSVDSAAGASSALAFADRMIALNDRDVGIINCAKGDTRITDWRRSGLTSTLYGACMATIQAALASGSHAIRGVIFIQGETDAARDTPADWSENFTRNIVDGFRDDLGDPDLPIVFARLGHEPSVGAWPAWSYVRVEQQQARVVINDPHVVMVDTDGLARKSDDLHWNTAGAITAGVRLANAMAPLLN